jgi:hypothetical protein
LDQIYSEFYLLFEKLIRDEKSHPRGEDGEETTVPDLQSVLGNYNYEEMIGYLTQLQRSEIDVGPFSLLFHFFIINLSIV